jgi:hypothetical protein
MGRLVNLEGKKFGRLKVLRRDGVFRSARGKTAAAWLCSCECGEHARIRTDTLGRGHTQSCGCLRRQRASEANMRHGGARRDNGNYREPEYAAWVGMKNRCYNPRNSKYRHWGGRGIVVYDKWVQDYPAFLADMGRKPSGRYELDRIDPDYHYCPGNVRWIEKGCGRRRNSRLLTHQGQTLTVAHGKERLDFP